MLPPLSFLIFPYAPISISKYCTHKIFRFILYAYCWFYYHYIFHVQQKKEYGYPHSFGVIVAFPIFSYHWVSIYLWLPASCPSILPEHFCRQVQIFHRNYAHWYLRLRSMTESSRTNALKRLRSVRISKYIVTFAASSVTVSRLYQAPWWRQ